MTERDRIRWYGRGRGVVVFHDELLEDSLNEERLAVLSCDCRELETGVDDDIASRSSKKSSSQSSRPIAKASAGRYKLLLNREEE